MRTSTAAVAAAMTTITPVPGLTATASPEDLRIPETPNAITPTPGLRTLQHADALRASAVRAAIRPAFAGHASIAAQMAGAADGYERHRRLVHRHVALAAQVAKLRGRALERRHERRARHWSDARLARGNARLHAKAREIRTASMPSNAATGGAATVSAPGSSSASASGGAGGALAAIRACESGGNYSANTGNGFYGAYQFTQQTWASVGGTGSPAAASPAEQDARAAALLARSGSSPWPACGG